MATLDELIGPEGDPNGRTFRKPGWPDDSWFTPIFKTKNAWVGKTYDNNAAIWERSVNDWQEYFEPKPKVVRWHFACQASDGQMKLEQLRNNKDSLKPFFTYYGGKYRISPYYPKPIFNRIIEPFAGSAGYSLRHYQKEVCLYDINERVVGVWNYLIRATPNEILILPEIIEDVRLLDIPQEAKWLIGFWCNKGSCEPRNKPSTWMKSGIRPNSQWGEAIKHRIASQLQFIRHWKCELKSYLDVNQSEATWFIDPPYSSSAGRLYTYDSIDYNVLGDWCKNRQGQKIVCEMEGANWLDFSPFIRAKGLEGPKGKKTIYESMWHEINEGN